MKMDRRLSNGLAWAGALLVIGIPAADYLAGTFSTPETANVAVVDVEQAAAEPEQKPEPVPELAEAAKPEPVKPVAEKPQAVAAAPEPKAAAGGDAVQGYMQSGRPLPSYITGSDAGEAVASAPAKPATPAQNSPVSPSTEQIASVAPVTETAAISPAATNAPGPEQVAAIPAKQPPVPMPLSMRPRQVSVPLASDRPLVIDEAVAAPVVAPPQPQSDIITAEDLEAWESGPLSDFLAQRSTQSSASYRVEQNEPVYEDEGFWLDEVPQGDRPIGRYPASDEQVYYLPF